jgi:adenylylsulfate kinase
MGPTASGKTTLAGRLLRTLRENQLPAIHFDGDEIRGFFGSELSFTPKDRLQVVRTIVHLANKSIDANLATIVSALTANQDARDYIKKHAHKLITVYLNCPINECMRRDPKGLYKRAQKGEIDSVIGFNSRYISPVAPDITIDTAEKSVDNCLLELLGKLQKRCPYL